MTLTNHNKQILDLKKFQAVNQSKQKVKMIKAVI